MTAENEEVPGLRELVRFLGSTEKEDRDEGLKKLEYFFNMENWSPKNLLVLWQGLFYGLWHTPGTLLQIEWAEKIAPGILKTEHSISVEFFNAFLQTIGKEWRDIDQHRLDKYYLLIRHLLRASIAKMAYNNWARPLDHINVLHKAIFKSDTLVPPGIGYHIVEIFLDEICTASKQYNLEVTSTDAHSAIFKWLAEILMSDDQSIVLKGKIRVHVFDKLLSKFLNGEKVEEPFGPTLKKDLENLFEEFGDESMAKKFKPPSAEEEDEEAPPNETKEESGELLKASKIIEKTKKNKKSMGSFVGVESNAMDCDVGDQIEKKIKGKNSKLSKNSKGRKNRAKAKKAG